MATSPCGGEGQEQARLARDRRSGGGLGAAARARARTALPPGHSLLLRKLDQLRVGTAEDCAASGLKLGEEVLGAQLFGQFGRLASVLEGWGAGGEPGAQLQRGGQGLGDARRAQVSRQPQAELPAAC